MSDQGPRNSSRQRARFTPVVRRIFEHHTGNSTFWLGSTSILREITKVVRGLPPLFPFHQPNEKVTRRLFRVLPCLKGTMHLQTSMSSPGFEPRPYSTADNVTNHYTPSADHSKMVELKNN
ncbi:hypothetical protein TNCV_4502041 [Trichonephila clavipes]|nr:hypothetical protein TNCV_4502041 [Trichonephila clavipes]